MMREEVNATDVTLCRALGRDVGVEGRSRESLLTAGRRMGWRGSGFHKSTTGARSDVV
jgi:hypothetical protein